MRKFLLLTLLAGLLTAPLHAQTPTAAQHCATGPQSELVLVSDSLNDYIIQCPNPMGNGNAMLVVISHDDGSAATESVSDGTNTYTLVQRVHDTTKGQFLSLFEAHNLAGHPSQITVSFSANTVAIFGSATEFYNIATTSPVDANSGNFGASTSITSGNMTPATSGDLLYQAMIIDSSASLPLTSFTVGSHANITWNFLATEKVFGQGIQYGVYNSTATINPTFTIAPSANFASITVALKAASAGTAPSGMYVSSVHHNNTKNETAAAPAFFWPPSPGGTANLRVIVFISSAARSVTSVSDGTNTWTQAGTGTNNDSDIQIFYSVGATTSSALTTTVNISGTNGSGHGDTMMAFDINGAATSPFDTSSGTIGNNVSGSITGAALTPGGGSGIILSGIGIAQDSITGITTSGSQFITTRSTGMHQPTVEDENNGWAIHAFSGTSTITDVWTHDTINGAAAGQWAAFAASFKAPPAAPSNPLGKRAKLERLDSN